MTDKELLEYAAKAAGYRLEWHIPKAGSDEPHIEGIDWNPLTDDGDALRLAVKLAIDFKIRNGATWWDFLVSEGAVYWGYEPHNNDPIAATRRAITRAAAEMGRKL